VLDKKNNNAEYEKSQSRVWPCQIVAQPKHETESIVTKTFIKRSQIQDLITFE
jgi:hypothetical protein